jgi:hypothetical protein
MTDTYVETVVATDLVDDGDAEATRRKETREAILSTVVLGVVLAVVFFPVVFNKSSYRDDEGHFIMALREFLHHGSLYVHTGSGYGPFYFTFIGLLYRITGMEPNLTNGRLIALVLTAVETGVLAAAVFRVTRSRLFSALCQFASFSVLVQVVGGVPLHPAPTILLLLAVLVYAAASYAMQPRPRLLIVVGAMIGAIAMSKINVGVLAAAAVVVALVVGNRRVDPLAKSIVAGGAVALPFVLASQRLSNAIAMQLIVMVSLTMLATLAALWADRVSFPGRSLFTVAWSALAAIAVSLVWPLLTGTSPRALLHGVFIAPLGQVERLVLFVPINFNWVIIVLTASVAVAAFLHRGNQPHTFFGSSVLPNLVFALVGLWLIGLGISNTFGAWLPAFALLPALAWIIAAPPTVRLALRFLVPLALLQALHAYPVAGAQKAWGTALMFVPSAIALAVGLNGVPAWSELNGAVRFIGLLGLAGAMTIMMGIWPPTVWRHYVDSEPVGLPGSSLVRLSPAEVHTARQLTDAIKANCDTFYTAPGYESLYVFTRLAPPTGLLRNWPGAHTASEQREIVEKLDAAARSGKRVCIVRDDSRAEEWMASSYGTGPLGLGLAPYQRRVAQVGPYSVSIRGPQSTS